MKIKCTSCKSDMNLDHEVFEEYSGPVKCFCCSTMMDIRISEGALDDISPSTILQEGADGVSADRAP